MIEIRKHFRGDLSYPIDSAANEELAKSKCKNYIALNPGVQLRLWDTVAKRWILWYSENEN